LKTALTLIEIIVVIVIIGIIAAIAIPNVTMSYRLGNENAARGNLGIISASMETYSTSNNGSYPTSEAQLTGAVPPYLYRTFSGSTIQGYGYVYSNLDGTGYTVTATPSSSATGSVTHTVVTGGVITP